MSYCSILFNHRFVDAVGNVKPCCRFSDKEFASSDISSFNSKSADKLRLQSMSGERITGCIRCYEEEDSGKKSLRQRYNENKYLEVDPSNPQLTWLELSISNECNLKCRMCDSKYSNKWYEEELALFGKAHKTKKIDITQIYDIIPTLKHLKITGGEPFVTPDHWKLLRHIVKSGYAKNIYLNYSTNCTVNLKGEYLDILREFKYVEITVSLDSIDKGELEYLRYPSKYEDVLENILEYKSYGFKIQARPTVTLLNVIHLPETLSWLSSNEIKFNATHLTYPSRMSIICLPTEYKNIVKTKYESYSYICEESKKQCEYILNYMINNSSDSFEEFVRVNEYLDKNREQSLKKINPELYKLVNLYK